MAYTPMVSTPTFNLLAYKLIGGSPKNNIKPYKLFGIYIVKELIMVNDKCGYLLHNILKTQ